MLCFWALLESRLLALLSVEVVMDAMGDRGERRGAFPWSFRDSIPERTIVNFEGCAKRVRETDSMTLDVLSCDKLESLGCFSDQRIRITLSLLEDSFGLPSG